MTFHLIIVNGCTSTPKNKSLSELTNKASDENVGNYHTYSQQTNEPTRQYTDRNHRHTDQNHHDYQNHFDKPSYTENKSAPTYQSTYKSGNHKMS